MPHLLLGRPQFLTHLIESVFYYVVLFTFINFGSILVDNGLVAELKLLENRKSVLVLYLAQVQSFRGKTLCKQSTRPRIVMETRPNGIELS